MSNYSNDYLLSEAQRLGDALVDLEDPINGWDCTRYQVQKDEIMNELRRCRQEFKKNLSAEKKRQLDEFDEAAFGSRRC